MSENAQSASGASILLREDAGGVVTLTLNRPAQLNSLSLDLLEALQSELDRAGRGDSGSARLFYGQLEQGLEGAYALASEAMACNMRSGDAKEGIDAFIEKRIPAWRGR